MTNDRNQGRDAGSQQRNPRRSTGAPLDGSTSGTIGGGGLETGGPTERPHPQGPPPANPDDAAGGRMSPDPLASTDQSTTENTVTVGTGARPDTTAPGEADREGGGAERERD
jgi:hypothetical protein